MQPGLYNKDGFTPFEKLLDDELFYLSDGYLYSNIYDANNVFEYNPIEYKRLVKKLKSFNIDVPYKFKDIKNDDLYDEIWNFFDMNFSSEMIVGKLVLPDDVKALSESAFCALKNLEEVVLPNTLERIEDSAFASCYKLKTVTLPDNIEIIPRSCFYNCSNLQEINFPKNLKKIRSNAFYQCESLKKITLPNSVIKIDVNTFMDCKNLEYVHLSKGIHTIPPGCFADCKNLTKIILNDYITAIQENAFRNCKNLVEFNFPSDLMRIGVGAFYGTGIKEARLPEAVKFIDNYAFSNCENLEKIFAHKKENIIIESNDVKKKIIYLEDITIDSILDSGKTFKQANQIYKDAHR